MSGPAHVVVVGGGISGLAAALSLRRRLGRAVRLTVCESSPRIGGKLAVSDVAGLPVDEGAEALLASRPEGVALVRSVGLGDALVPAQTAAAGIWTRGRMRRLPPRQVMGVPADLRALTRSGAVSAAGVVRATADLVAPRGARQRAWGDGPDDDEDVAIGAYVAARLGREVVDRLVDPLLGGVYAGRADALSLRATTPSLAEAARGRRSLFAAARAVLAAGTRSGPSFVSLRGGLGRLPDAVAGAAAADVRMTTPVRSLHRQGSGWRLTVGPASEPQLLSADAVVLAVPAPPAARLLASVLPAAASELERIDYASVATVSLAFTRSDVPGPLAGSGFLVPAVDGRRIKGVTFLSSKWSWLADADRRTVVVRCSVGRHGAPSDLQTDDESLVGACLTDLAATVGLRARPVDARVRRWGGALPQYAVGHGRLVARVRAAIESVPGLAVCGAAYDGIGVPACVASAESAAAQVSGSLAAWGGSRGTGPAAQAD